MAGPRILFVTDGGPEIGGGHVMRSLTLAGALAQKAADCAFLAPADAAGVLHAFAPPTLERHLPDAPTPQALIEAAATLAPNFDAVVFDHFRIAAAEHRRAAAGRPSLAIDDMADRPLGAGMVVDLGPDRRAEDYRGLLPPTCRLLLGPGYALVRPAFADRRAEALARRGAPTVGRILVSLGLTDVGGVTGRVTDALLPHIGDAAVDAVIGRQAPSRAGLEALAARDPRVTVHIESQDMAGLMTRADLAVGAGGSSTWERCVLGLPTLLLILAPNQAPSALALQRLGAARVLDVADADFDEALTASARSLVTDDAARTALVQASAALCDGAGAARLAEAFLAYVADPGS